MTEVTSSSASSELSKSEESTRKPGKLGNMVSMFEKKAEEKQQPPQQTRSASNSLTNASAPITPVPQSASTSAASSPAPRVGASIADRMAAMKGLTMATPAPPPTSSHAMPGKLSANAKTLPLSFDPPAASASSSSPSASSSSASGSAVPRPNKLAIGGLGALNAALANGLKAGLIPGGVRSPSASITKREDASQKAALDSRTDEHKEETLLQTAPAAISALSEDGAAGGGGAPVELTHAKRVKRAGGRTKAVSRPGGGTLTFKAFSDVSKAADMKAAVTIIGGEKSEEQTAEETKAHESTKSAVASESKEQPAEHSSTTKHPAADTHATATSSEQSTISTSAATSATVAETETSTPKTSAPAHEVVVPTKPIQLPAAQIKAETLTTHTAAAPIKAVESALDTSSASIASEDSLDSSFSSVASSVSAASLDSSFTGDLSVYNAAADYFQDATTLGFNPALHARYSTLLHTGATFHRWQATGSSAKRLLYLSDCATFLCLVDSKKRLPLDKVEPKRRLPVAALSEVVKGKAATDEVWARSACKDVLPGRCLLLRCGGEGVEGEGMLNVMHVEGLTGVQRDEWEEALRWLIATKGKGSTGTDR